MAHLALFMLRRSSLRTEEEGEALEKVDKALSDLVYEDHTGMPAIVRQFGMVNPDDDSEGPISPWG